ncbi:translocation/assembly module TamB domain-containing protein [Sphingomonas sp.]|uniref:translocation/assembly module TamB domain-containing protein n=1 Tax=Sphingomonas sp. TaxID=28214 RepID=UPI002DB7882F|nr:translocation/assembly module TamB domain-containing protein [Sphingomonas sp.]HEU4970134.1 translocation/assembly module TamB domain-containing protein [Sphingomonas sp.]
MDEGAPAPAKKRRRWRLALLPVALLLAVLAGLWGLDTSAGHRFLIDRIEQLQIRSGLRIRIGRIEGSIYGSAHLKDVRFYDPQGLFLSAPDIKLRWTPWRWTVNRLDIDQLTAATATLHKVPQFRKTGRPFTLPSFDIRLGRLAIDRLRIVKGVAGPERVGALAFAADVRSGRAMVQGGAWTSAGDRLKLLLDVEPKRHKFDLGAQLVAPADGVIGKLIGTSRPLALRIAGKGNWTVWNGTAQLDASDKRIVDTVLQVREGEYRLNGGLFFETVTKGRLQRLSGKRIAIDGHGTLEGGILTGRLKLRSDALALQADGGLDLERGQYDALMVRASLLQPPALFKNMSGRDVRLLALFDGPYGRAKFRYEITSPIVHFDNTGFEQARIVGAGRLSPSPVTVPIRFTARRVTGVGDVAGGILANLQVDGLLKVTGKAITGDNLRVRSDKLTSTASLFVDLRTGDYDVRLAGELRRYYIPGLGIVDVKTTLSVVPGANRRGTHVTGRAQAWVRRFDNGFLAGLAGGLPYLEAALVRDRDGIVHFTNLRITAPSLVLTGNGYRRRDGTFHFEGGGRQATYGALRLTLDGRIERPRLDILLPRPLDALGIADMRLLLEPTATGFGYRAGGRSSLGPWTSAGAILLPKGEPARIDVGTLAVAGLTATGELTSHGRGFDGRLRVTGPGLAGMLDFDRPGDLQRISLSFDAANARIATEPEIRVVRGGLDGEVVLDPKGLVMRGTVTARGLRRGPLSLARLAASIDLQDGRGQVKAALAGSRGRAFDLQTVAQVSPERLTVTGGGTIDRKPVHIDSPAVLTAERGGWRLAPTALSYGGGQLKLAGLFGAAETEVEATLTAVPMTVFDIVTPNLGLGGTATGRIRYREGGVALPSGSLDLTVRRLTRSSLVLTSKPIDLGLKAVLNGSQAAARAVAASDGKVIGRAQARLAPLPIGGDLATRLSNAPLFAQLRYAGPADTLWRLTGIQQFDLSGSVAIAADIGGRLPDPVIRGSIKATGARLESSTTGTVLTNLDATGRFGGSQLVIDRMTATAGQGGSVTGTGTFDFGARQGVGMDLTVNAHEAVLLNRDDIGAAVTGPLRITSNGYGGLIAGEVTLDRSRYRLGRARAETTVSRLANLSELNRPADEMEPPAPPAPWQLDLKATARNRLMVTGLGLDSEWRAGLAITGTVGEPVLVGTATLLRGGYEFAGRRFDLERGTIRFNGASPPDPVLDIAANANIQGLSATIRVTGTGLKPEVAFTSNPALPEDELLSRLLFGTSITNLSAPEAVQLASAVAALQSGGGLDPINALRRAVGLDRLRIIAADPTIGQGTAIAAGKYITRRAFVELITDGQGYSATRVEFQITRWLSVLSTISTIGRQSANVRVSKDY